MAPGAALLGMTQAVAKQVLHQPVLRAALVLFRCGSSPHQVAQRFMRGVGNPHRREQSAAVALGKLERVTAIRLDALVRLFGDERRRDHLALDAELGELPEERVAGRSGLVANLELIPNSELVDDTFSPIPASFGTARGSPAPRAPRPPPP